MVIDLLLRSHFSFTLSFTGPTHTNNQRSIHDHFFVCGTGKEKKRKVNGQTATPLTLGPVAPLAVKRKVLIIRDLSAKERGSDHNSLSWRSNLWPGRL
jgi:hypothetical protein